MLIKWDWGSDTVNAQWLSALSSAHTQKKTAEERTVQPEWRLKNKKYSTKTIRHIWLKKMFSTAKYISRAGLNGCVCETVTTTKGSLELQQHASVCVCVCVPAWMQAAGLRKKRVFCPLLRLKPGWVLKHSHSLTSNSNFFNKSTSVVFRGEPLNLAGNFILLCSDALIRPILALRTPECLMIYGLSAADNR